MPKNRYINGDYLKDNPTWHVEDSPWKAKQILKMIKRNNVMAKTICEVGCGAGEILRQLQQNLNEECMFSGYEISPQAYKLCKTRANERLQFKLKDFLLEDDVYYDLILIIDLIEHLEDYFGFLRNIKTKSHYKIFHIPLELSVLSVLRSKPLFVTRDLYGHINYLSKELAIQILEETGYEVIDHFYTSMLLELPAKSIKSAISNTLRKIAFPIHKDLCVRMLGGYSIMILAE